MSDIKSISKDFSSSGFYEVSINMLGKVIPQMKYLMILLNNGDFKKKIKFRFKTS